MLGHTIAYIIAIALSLLTAYAMGKPAPQNRGEQHEVADTKEQQDQTRDDDQLPR